MRQIRTQYELTAITIGYAQGRRRAPHVTFRLDAPGLPRGEKWSIPVDGVPPLDEGPGTDAERALAPVLDRVRAHVAVGRLVERGEPLWLAITPEHPLLAAVAWERGLSPLGVPVLRLPAQLNIAPIVSTARPRVAIWVSVPGEPAAAVGRVLDALDAMPVPTDAQVFAEPDQAAALRAHFGSRAELHAPGPRDQAWLTWIEQQTEGRIDILHLIGDGRLATGQGGFAVGRTPEVNVDAGTARLVWPQQLGNLMSSTGAWGLVVSAPDLDSAPALRLLASQVAGLRAAATAFQEGDDAEATAEVYRLLLEYPAAPPTSTRDLALTMHPGRYGLTVPSTGAYRPATTVLDTWVEQGVELPAWMLGAQRQVHQWETELCFDSTSGPVEATRAALEVVKSRLDAVIRDSRGSEDTGTSTAGGDVA